MPARRRFFLILLAPAILGLASAVLLLWWLLPAPVEALTVEGLLADLKVLAPLVPQGSGEELQAWARALPGGTDLRVTVISADGRVLAESARSQPLMEAMENHLGRPEVRRALAAGEGWSRRRSATTGEAYIYAARTFSDRAGGLRILRLARPLAALPPIQQRIALALVPSALIALAALWWLSRRLDGQLLRPLEELIRETDRRAAGESREPLPVPEAELPRRLAQAVSRLAGRGADEVAAVAAERDHLRRILAGVPEGLLVIGADGRALLANPAFHRLFALPAEEVAGRAPRELIRHPRLGSLIEATLESGRGETAEIETEWPEQRSLALGCTSLGPGGGAVLVARDTTDLTRLNRMRRDFVANVSHELKTPLAAIRAYAETLSDGALEEGETARRFLDRMLSQCQRLEALLDDLLTLSRLESPDAASALPPEPVLLPPVLTRALEVVAGAAAERGIALCAAELAPAVVRGQGESLERLAVNLLDNAVKYGRPGGEVRLRLTAGGGECTLEVRDDGIGIPAAALPRLFERFYRVDRGRSRAEGGTGLGLAIVKHITQLHGGRVEVESEEDRGSTFRVHLPLVESDKKVG